MKKAILCWIGMIGIAAAMGAGQVNGAARPAKPVRVVVWDEQQPAQKQAYENFLGNAIADHLRTRMAGGQPEFSVRSVRLDDPQQGLGDDVLDNADVLIWWGHVRHGDIKPETAKAIVRRVKAGQLSLISLHSAHWSMPFIEAMNERATDDALKTLTEAERKQVRIRTIPAEKRLAIRGEPLTPSFTKTTQADGTALLEIRLPSCVFPAVRADGKPSHVRTLLRDHPIARGVPAAFDIPQTEMYDEPFHVPTPDAVIFEERWDAGEHFRSGCLWKVGAGRVFYFRPGHETYPIFKQAEVLRILENAARWLGTGAGEKKNNG